MILTIGKSQTWEGQATLQNSMHTTSKRLNNVLVFGLKNERANLKHSWQNSFFNYSFARLALEAKTNAAASQRKGWAFDASRDDLPLLFEIFQGDCKRNHPHVES